MKQTYILGIDIAKHKVRAALSSGAQEPLLFEKDLPVSAAGLGELLVRLREHVAEPQSLLVLIEATGVLHLNWSAALLRAGYTVVVINPLIARRLYTLENSIRDNKSDPIDARGLCGIGRSHGEKLLSLYRFTLKPEQLCLQRLHSVRKALRKAIATPKSAGTIEIPLREVRKFVWIGNDVEIGANTTIDRGSIDDTVIGAGTKVDNLVQIGHNCMIGRHCIIIAECGLDKHMAIVGYLKSEHGMGHGHANALVGWTLAGNVARP